VKTGTVTAWFVVTVCVAVVGPLQPAAEAVTIEVPLQPAAYVTAPVPATIVFPPARLSASSV
jgi:hypothetical protein